MTKKTKHIFTAALCSAALALSCAAGIAVGIVVAVTGIAAGIVMIISGAHLLIRKRDLMI